MRSPNYSKRRGKAKIDMLIVHCFGDKSCAAAKNFLCDKKNKVSAHYLVCDNGVIHQLVDEDKRAWHAGCAFWAGQTDINSCSIGIEVFTPKYKIIGGDPDFSEAQFTRVQMDAVQDLCADIVEKYKILPHRVLAHSDIAPARKRDPGEKFDWQHLAQAGIGLWMNPPAPDDNFIPARQAEAIRRLKNYGYQTDKIAPEIILRAFQRHYRPARVDGRLDESTWQVLTSLTDMPVSA